MARDGERLEAAGPAGTAEAARPDLTVIAPFYCEEATVPELVARLAAVLDGLGRKGEVILVDDGSTDGTAERIAAAAAADGRITGVYLARNYGQTTALQAGFDHARGAVIVTIDGDLQNDPADIPRLLAAMEESGADVVSGWRRDRKDGWLRVLLSGLANRLIAWITRVPLRDFGCTLKAYRHDKVEQIRIYGEMHRFLPAVMADVGSKVVEVEVGHHRRRHGRSKYGLDRAFRVALDLLLVRFLHKYIHRPMHFFGGWGLVALVPGAAICGYLLFIRLFLGESVGSRPLLTLGVFLLGTGIILLAQGLIGEMLSRVLFEATERKQYRLRRKDPAADRRP